MLGFQQSKRGALDDEVHHKCGFAYIRLRKPFDYFAERYEDPDFLLNLMYPLLLKQRNRGQDATGIATCYPYKERPGQQYLYCHDKSVDKDPVDSLFDDLFRKDQDGYRKADDRRGMIMIGHNLYSTVMRHLKKEFVHPVEKPSHWVTRRIALVMNGNFANNREQREFLETQIEKHLTSKSDMATLAETFGHYLNKEHRRNYELLIKEQPDPPYQDAIAEGLDLTRVMSQVNNILQGAFAIAGIVGCGDSFVARDPQGTRPAFYFANDDFVAAASEPGPLFSVFQRFGVQAEEIKKLPPGHIMTVKASGDLSISPFTDDRTEAECHFEDDYFMRENSPDTYTARIDLGEARAPEVKKRLEANPRIVDLRNVVYSHVPNTAEVGGYGLFRALQRLIAEDHSAHLKDLFRKGILKEEDLNPPLMIEYDKAISKDAKARTFIMAKHIRSGAIVQAYDSIYDVAQKYEGGAVVLVEDSVVKGNTLEKNVCATLARAGAQDIYIVSTCPQIRGICCYGIEMSTFKEFIAWRAAIALTEERGLEDKLAEIEEVARFQQQQIDNDSKYLPKRNLVQEVYDWFTYDEVTDKISELVTPKIDGWDGQVHVLYPTVPEYNAALNHRHNHCLACLNNEYPELGGYRVSNMALLNFFDDVDEIAY